MNDEEIAMSERRARVMPRLSAKIMCPKGCQKNDDLNLPVIKHTLAATLLPVVGLAVDNKTRHHADGRFVSEYLQQVNGFH
jgi:hypothetical protein